MAFDERLLHRMQLAARRTCRLSTVKTALPSTDGNSRMQALIGFHASALAGALGEHDRARAAIAFGAAFLRAGEPPFVAQELEQRRLRRQAGDVDAFAVQQEADGLAHIRTASSVRPR